MLGRIVAFALPLLIFDCGKRSVSEREIPINGPKTLLELKGFWAEESFVIERNGSPGDRRNFSTTEGRLHAFGENSYNRLNLNNSELVCPNDQSASIQDGVLKVQAATDCAAFDSVIVKVGPEAYEWVESRLVKETRVLTRYRLRKLTRANFALYSSAVKSAKNSKSQLFASFGVVP